MDEQRPAVQLSNIRRAAQRALDRGQKLDPRAVLDLAEGKRA